MSIVTLSDFRTFLRQVPDNDLDAMLQQALDAAESHVEKFIGYPLSEFDPGPVPPEIKSAIAILAQLEVDELAPEIEQVRRGRAESLLRPYRKETGIAGGQVAA